MTLKEFRKLLQTNEEKAIKLWNDEFSKGLDVNQASQNIGFSWGAVRPEIYALGYNKPKNRLICKTNEQGEKVMNKDTKSLKLTEEEILYIKELYKNRSNGTEDISIKTYDDYKQRSILISEALLNELDNIYSENKIYKKQDIFNEIIKLGIDTYFKNFKK